MKIAVLLPIHPPKFNYSVDVINSLKDKIDFYVIFTNHYEKDLYQKSYNLDFNYFVLSDYFKDEIIDLIIKKNLTPVIKKLYFVSKLINSYDFIIPLDADFKIINTELFYQACKSFCHNKTFIGGRSSLNITRNIIESSMKLVNKHKSFYRLNRYKDIYFWLSEIPIYEKHTTIDFLNFINFNKIILEIIFYYDYNLFDTLSYNYFCVMEYDYQIKEINYNFSLEDCPLEVWEDVNKNIKTLYSINHNIYRGQDVALLIHLDRTDGESYLGVS
jgi:hypothetical protein